MNQRLSFTLVASVVCLMPIVACAATTKTAPMAASSSVVVASSSAKSVQVSSSAKSTQALAGPETNAQLETKARKGDVDAAYALGMNYYTGSNKTKKDDKKAVIWLSLAILEGKTVADQYELETYFSQHLTDTERDALTVQLNVIMANIPTLRGRTDISMDATQDVQRKKDIGALADALIKYYTEHKKKFPVTLPRKSTEICRTSGPDCKNLVDLSNLVGQYIKAIPIDPIAKIDAKGARYFLTADKNTLTITAPAASEKGVKTERKY